MRFLVGIGACEKLRHEEINALTFRWIHCRDMKTNHQLLEGPTIYLTPSCQSMTSLIFHLGETNSVKHHIKHLN